MNALHETNKKSFILLHKRSYTSIKLKVNTSQEQHAAWWSQEILGLLHYRNKVEEKLILKDHKGC